MSASPLMDVTECAARYFLSRSTVYQYVHEKRMPYIKIGSRLLFVRDETDAHFLQRRPPLLERRSQSRFEKVRERIRSLKTEGITQSPVLKKGQG